MTLAFVVPGALEQLTGGYLFARHLVDGMRALRRGVEVHELPGAVPEADDIARTASAALLASVPDGAAVVIDGLALPAFAESLTAAAAARLKLIGFIHHPLAFETGLPLEARERLAIVEARLLPRLKGILCPSLATARHVEEYGVPAARTRVAPPGTAKPPQLPRRATRDGAVRLLTVAAVTPRKGHLLLVEALATVTQRPWQLLCVGSLGRDPDTALALEQAIARHGLGGRIVLAGEWPPARIGAAYADADLFVLPSHHEGYGMAFAEAMAFGLPIIATTAGAIADTVPADAALLVPPGDREALARALTMVLADPGLRSRLAAGAARAGAALPDWDAATRNWLASLDFLLA